MNMRTLAAISLLLLSGSCARETPEPVAESVPLTKVQVAARPTLSFAPIFIAADEGFFEAEGLDVDVLILGGVEGMTNLALGEVDVYAGFVTVGLLNAVRRGERIRIVADKGHLEEGCADFALMARKGILGSEALEDVDKARGLRISTLPSTAYEFAVDKFLEPAGVTLRDIGNVPIPPNGIIPAFADNLIDIRVASEPMISEVRNTGTGDVFKALHEVAPGMQFAVVVYGPSLLDENPEVGRRFMRAYLRGVKSFNEGKTERNIEVLARHTQLDSDVIRAACWPHVRDDGAVNVESLEEFAEWALNAGYIDGLVASEDLWYPGFLELDAGASVP